MRAGVSHLAAAASGPKNQAERDGRAVPDAIAGADPPDPGSARSIARGDRADRSTGREAALNRVADKVGTAAARAATCQSRLDFMAGAALNSGERRHQSAGQCSGIVCGMREGV